VLNGLLPTPSDGTQLSPSHVGKLYVFAVMWSIGATLELDDRGKMEAFMKETLDLDLPVIEDESHHTIFEYFINKEGI